MRRRKKNNGIGTEIGMCYDIADINRLSDGFDSRYLLAWENPVDIRKMSKNLISTGFLYAITGGIFATSGGANTTFGGSKL